MLQAVFHDETSERGENRLGSVRAAAGRRLLDQRWPTVRYRSEGQFVQRELLYVMLIYPVF